MVMKKILCMVENLGQGGAERQLIGLATLLAKERNRVKIIIYDKDFFYLPLLQGTGVECEYIEKAKNRFRRIPQILRFVKSDRPDVVISFLVNPSIIACIVKWILGGFKLIVSERNTNQSISLKDRIRFKLFKHADWIVPNSNSQNVFIKTHYPKLADKVVTITNFVDTIFFCPNEKNKEKQVTDAIKIVCVGRISQQKNVKLFIQATKKVVDSGVNLRVDWYGLSFHPYSDECDKLLKSLHLEEMFCFHKETSDVKSVYHQADVMILPSLYEGFPNVVCEAMSCGLPVLCSDICDNGRIVRNNINGFLFNPNLLDDIADKIIKFSRLSSEERKSMCRKSREFAISDFSQELFFNKYKKLIYE